MLILHWSALPNSRDLSSTEQLLPRQSHYFLYEILPELMYKNMIITKKLFSCKPYQIFNTNYLKCFDLDNAEKKEIKN